MDNGLSELLQGIDIERLKEKAGPLLAALTEHGESGEETESEEKTETKALTESFAPLMSMLGAESGMKLDPMMLSKLASALNDKRSKDSVQLLYALKPFLSEKRSEKMASAVNILRMTSMLRGMNDIEKK
ncbi:MAG: hypothetical protein E7491_09760 [Ruminococcaceae bacterium]|nr:hypothetical protein [Oscillospiraceae bacterium]